MLGTFSSLIFAKSPLSAGVYSLSGSIFYSYTKINNDKDKVTELSLTTTMLYFFNPKIAVGGSILYNERKIGEASFTNKGIGPTIRYYPTDNNLNFYLFGGFNFSLSRLKSLDRKISFNSYFLGCGFDIFIARNIALNPKIRYMITKEKRKENTEESQMLFIGLGIDIFIY